MIILGLETSCDETAAAVVENGTKILSSVVSSSLPLHQKTGGIIPEVASREQLKFILPVIQKTIENCPPAGEASKLKIENLNALAVTTGPGLIGSLLVGVQTARTLSWLWQKPLIPVNHLKAHLYANFLNTSKDQRPMTNDQLPAIGLIVSGGHTDLVLLKSHQALKWLGGTRDDASGECFDKCARLLGLGYPGGPAIAAAAAKLKSKNEKLKINLPRPMINNQDFDFSFSGLKTAVLQKIKNGQRPITNDQRLLLAYEIQEAITDVLVAKTLKAAQKFKVRSILIGGGVAANSLLRKKLNVKCQMSNVKCFVPPVPLCTDNAAVIASCAYFNYHPVPWQKIKANPGLTLS